MEESPKDAVPASEPKPAVPGSKTPQSEKSKLISLLIIGASIGFLIAFPVICLLLLGMALDAFFHKHIFAIAGAVIGFLGSFVNIYKFMKKIS